MKTFYFLFLVGIIFISSAYSIDTSNIEALRNEVKTAKRDLTASENDQISRFITRALDQMMISQTSDEVVEIRRQIEEQKGDDFLSYYTTAYISVAYTDIQAAFANARRLEDARQKIMIDRNLMILVAELKSPKLADLALSRLDDSDDLIRYWAVKSLVQSAMIQQLSGDTSDEQIRAAVLKGLKDCIIDEKQSHIQSLTFNFCQAFSDDPLARETLMSIASRRIDTYKKWTAKNLTSDVSLLSALGNVAMVQTDPEIKASFGRAFAELYALAFQWYFKGGETLSEQQMEDLLTVLAEVDKRVLDRTMKLQTGILRSLQQKRGLDREYEVLFGDRLRSGQLANLFKFDYGKDESGKPITAPEELPPPQADTSEDEAN